MSWSCVALCRFWFFCCCVRVLLRGGLREALAPGVGVAMPADGGVCITSMAPTQDVFGGGSAGFRAVGADDGIGLHE